jgi:DNA-binding transcriptional MerR regulator
LSSDGGATFPTLITASTPAAAGSYNWVVPDKISQTSRIKITDVSDSAVFDVSDANFKIRGNLTLNVPDGGEVWLINSSHDITWTRFGSIANAKLEYSKDGGVTYPFTIIGSIDASLERYSWTIPDNPSPLVRVRISDAADPTVYDTSAGNFVIRGGFVLTSPNGAETWAVGSSHNITWSTFGSIANVKLEYSTDNKAHWNVIIGTTSNVNVYSWTIPDAISAQCIVRVSDTQDPDANDVSDAVFKIHGLLVVTSPNGGEEWSVGSARSITWTRTGSIANVRLTYSTNGGTTYPYLIADPVTAGSLMYNWTVPDAISTNVKVKISDSSDATVYDESNSAFKIKGAFTVTSPNGGESWGVATVHNITWTTLGTVANVKLDYSTNSGTDWTVITATVANINSYPWTIPDAISNTCRVQVSDASDSSAFDISNNNFKIGGELIITAPNGGEKWSVGSSRVITWNRVGSIANIKLEYSDNNGVTYVIITNSTPNTGSYGWTVPNAITTQALVRITNVDDPTVTDISNAVFKIQASFTLTAPNGGENWLVGSAHDITWSWNGTVPYVKLRYTTNGGTSFTAIVTSTSNNGTYAWTVPDSVSGTVRVRVSDASDDEAYDDSNSDFRIRCAFSLTAPNGGEQWRVGRSQNITWGNVGTIANVKLVYSRDNFLTDNQVISAATPNTGLFAWTIPNSINDHVKVRISDPNDIGAYDDSNNDFRITADFTVTSPNGGEKWDVNTTHDITWTWAGTVPEVKIEYSIDGGATYKLITAIENTGSYSWYVPDEITAQFKVRVSDLADPTAFDVSNANAKIKAAFTLLTPNGGQTLTVGENYEVTWSSVGTVPNVKLEYSLDNFVTPVSIIASTPNDGSHIWKVPNAPTANGKVRVMSTADTDAFDISDSAFTIVRGEIALTAPNGGERWVTGENHQITWQNVTGSIPKVNIAYSKDNFGTGPQSVLTIVANLDNPAAPSSNSYNWTIPDDRSTTVKVRISDVRDVTVNDISENNFTIGYYTVYFEFRDLITNKTLTELSAKGTSDTGYSWEASEDPQNPGSPLGPYVTVQLPAGYWNILWTKTKYSEVQSSFNLTRDLLKTDITWFKEDLGLIHMETTAIHIWRAYSDYAYSPATDVLTVSSWLERDGYVVTGGVRCGVYVYDAGALIDMNPATPLTGQDVVNNTTGIPEANPDGTTGDGIDDGIEPLLDPSPDSGGFFVSVWNNTGLNGGKVYTTITDIVNASGVHFRTPGSFTVSAEKKLQEVQDTVNSVLDKPISEVAQELQETLAAQTVIIQGKLDDQKDMIETKMDEQIQVIEDKTDEMMDAVNTTLTSFETRTNEAITKLQAGADQAVSAGETLESTAKKFSWRAAPAPDPAMTGDTITINCQGMPRLSPIIALYSWDNKTIVRDQILTETTPGLYIYQFTADDRFVPGKAYTFIVTESTTSGLVAGSGMVESMSITTVAGLASAAPEAERAAKKALDAIKAIEAVLTSGDNINIALTLKNLKESVDALPEVLNREGPSTKLTETMNGLTTWLKALVGNEGYDIGGLLEKALSSSPTIKEMRGKTDEIDQVIDILMQLFECKFGGIDSPIISTSLQPGSVRFRIVAVNPSKTRTQKVQVKNYLPEEAKPKDIMDLGGLELEYDSAKSIYYVYKFDVELAPGEMRVFEVEVEDIWMVPKENLEDLKSRTDLILSKVKGTEYFEKAKEVADTIYPRLDEIAASQADDSISREQHIGVYRQNGLTIDQIKEALAKLEKMLATAGGPLAPEMLTKTKVKAESPTKTITWVVIFIVIIFVGLLAGVLFFTWHRQTRLTREELLAAKKTAFPGGPHEEQKE